jgi:hypothetical protein
MTVNDIIQLACNECGDTGAEMQSYLKTAIPLRYELMYNSFPWAESMQQPHYEFAAQAALAIPNAAQAFWMPQILPLQQDRVMWAKMSSDAGVSFPYELKYRERHWIENSDESAFLTTTGQLMPKWFFHGQPVAFPLYSPLILTFTPTVSVTSMQVTIQGRDTGGLEQSETLTLSGVTPASTVNSYAEVHTISKSVTGTGTGPISITASAGNTVFGAAGVTMQPNDENLRYTTIVIWPAYSGLPNLTLRVGAKLKIDDVTNLNAIPRISGLHTALYYFARSCVLAKQKQWDLSKQDEGEAGNIFNKLIQAEQASQAAFQQIVPKVYDDPNDVWNSWTAWGQ